MTPDEQIVFSLPFTAYPNDSHEDLARRVRSICTASEPATTPVPSLQAPLSTVPPLSTSPMEKKLHGILGTYNVDSPFAAPVIRNFVLGNLVLLSVEAKNENTKTKCLEMLGKTKDVALFEERSTILVEHMTTEQIQDELRRKVARIRGEATTLPATPFKDIT